MGLAEELKQSRSNEAAQPAGESGAEASQQISFDMNQAATTEPAEQAQVEAQPQQEVQAAEEGRITIGDKEFASQEEAISYAQEIERKRIVDEAYRKGLLDAQPKDQKDLPPSIEKQVEDLLFENPAEALRIYREEIEKQITSKINETQTRQTQEKDMWNQFYTDNQDLAKHKDLVEFVLEKNWNDIAHINLDKGLKKLAENARKILSSYQEESKPREVLQSKPAVVPGASQSPAPVAEAAAQKAVDFIAQVKKHRTRTLGEEMERLGIKK